MNECLMAENCSLLTAWFESKTRRNKTCLSRYDIQQGIRPGNLEQFLMGGLRRSVSYRYKKSIFPRQFPPLSVQIFHNISQAPTTSQRRRKETKKKKIMSIACKDCVTGSLHPGAPSGHEETLHGFPTYIASPPAELFPSGPTATVVIISDAFGWILPNARLLADRYARRAGWRVLLPDFLNGTSLDAALLEDIVIVAGNKTGILGKL